MNVMASIDVEPVFDDARLTPLRQVTPANHWKFWIDATGVWHRMLAAGWQTPLFGYPPSIGLR